MKKILKWAGIGFLVLIGISFLAALGSKNPSSNQTISQQPTEAKQTAPEPTKVIQFTFDVLPLVGKNVDEVKTILLPYKNKTLEPTAQQIALGVKEWDMEFTKDGKDLLVTYNISSRQIVDFFISTDDPSGKTKDKDHLLEIGNLSESSNQYKVVFVPTLKDSSYFTGIKVIPNN